MTGLKSTLFNKVAQATQEIHSHFDREFEDGTLATWNINSSDDDEGPELIASNRYFTPVLDTGGTKNMPFGQGVDPHGVLAHMLHSGSGPTYLCTWRIIKWGIATAMWSYMVHESE